MRYAPYANVRGRAHVVVDGAAQAGTVLTLSHWPGSATPPELAADLSAEIALNARERSALPDDTDVVTNNHFDEDGLMSVYALLGDDASVGRYRDRIVDVAAAGDFGSFRERASARIAFAIAALAVDVTDDPYDVLLPIVPDLLARPDDFEKCWRDEDDRLQAGIEAIDAGRVRIEELPSVDVAVVRLAADEPLPHPVALDNSTGCFCLLVEQGRSYSVQYRYETWVNYVSRPVRARRDLGPLAEELTLDEPGPAHWEFDGVSAIMPELRLVGAEASAIEPERFRERLVSFLEAAPPAWNPRA